MFGWLNVSTAGPDFGPGVASPGQCGGCWPGVLSATRRSGRASGLISASDRISWTCCTQIAALAGELTLPSRRWQGGRVALVGRASTGSAAAGAGGTGRTPHVRARVRCSARRPAGGGNSGCRVIGRCRTRHGEADAHAEAEGAACQGQGSERSPKFHIVCPFLVCVARQPDHANLGVRSEAQDFVCPRS